MPKRQLYLLAAFCFVLGLIAAATAQPREALRPSSTSTRVQSDARFQLRSLSTSRAEASKLDWIFLNARVDVLTDLGTQNPIPRFSYDQKGDRVIATAWTSGDWFKSTPLQKIKDTAEDYCSAVFIQEHAFDSALAKDATLDDHVREEKEVFRHCYVEFVTVASGGHAVAVFQNGELILK